MKKDEDEELLKEAKDRVDLCLQFYGDIFNLGSKDQEFVYGINQWTPEEKRSRDIDGLPSLVLNQLKPFSNQVINDIRQSRPALRVVPVDDSADPETAEVISGIIRNIEYRSKAHDSYDTAAKNAVEAGLGWLVVGYDYAGPMTFNQEIHIDRIVNFESAMIDPNHTELDGSDAEYGFVFEDVPKDAFEEEYPDSNMEGFEQGFWQSEDTVKVTSYYYKDYETITIYEARYEEGGRSVDGVITQKEKELLEEAGIEVEVLDERETRYPKMYHCLITGNEILEKTEWLGKYVPIVPVVGDECFLDGKRQFRSLIHHGKDAQRMYNYWKSASTAFIALQPKAPWVAPKGSFESYRDEWEDSNRLNLSTLEYDVVYGENNERVEPPSRAAPIQGSPAMMQEAMNARDDIRLSIGMPLSNMGEKDNAISGVAIRNRQIEGDNATFHFIDNLASALSHLGVIIVDLIPKVYSKPQMQRILGEDGKEEVVPINQPFVKDAETGDKRPVSGSDQKYDGVYKLGVGQYDVVCDVGPSYSSKRQETADKLTELINAKPDLMQVVGDLVFDSLDLPGGKQIADRIRSQMDPSLLGDDPQAEKLKAAAQTVQKLQERIELMDAALQEKQENVAFDQRAQMAKIQIERDKLAVEAQKVEAEVTKLQSEAAENVAQTENQRVETQVLIESLMERVSDIDEAFEFMLDSIERNRENIDPEKAVEVNVITEEVNDDE